VLALCSLGEVVIVDYDGDNRCAVVVDISGLRSVVTHPCAALLVLAHEVVYIRTTVERGRGGGGRGRGGGRR
jgi:hypothetical protein